MKNKQSRYSLFLKRIAQLQIQYPLLVLLTIVLLTLLFAIPAQDVQTVASLEQMMPQDTPAIKAFNDLRDQELGRDAIAVLLRIDTQGHNQRVNILGEDTDQYVQILKKNLLEETSVHEVQTHLQNPAFINQDQTEVLLIAYTDAAGDDTRMKRLASRVSYLSEQAVPYATKPYLTGTPIIQQRLGEYIQTDQQRTRLASTLLVLLITALLFGFTSSLIPILTVTLSVSWLYGTMGLFGLPISTLAGGVAAMVIGIGIDFAIHLMNKFKFERKNGLSIPEAIQEAVVHTGTALSVTALTTGAAFLSFLVGVMPEMGRFGILMALGIFYALVLTLMALPALLVLEERLIAYFSKKARFGIEGEYKLVEDKQ
ncbi:MAG: MMPL family transporter [Candidatus Woesearchaeota archaeon]